MKLGFLIRVAKMSLGMDHGLPREVPREERGCEDAPCAPAARGTNTTARHGHALPPSSPPRSSRADSSYKPLLNRIKLKSFEKIISPEHIISLSILLKSVILF